MPSSEEDPETSINPVVDGYAQSRSNSVDTRSETDMFDSYSSMVGTNTAAVFEIKEGMGPSLSGMSDESDVLGRHRFDTGSDKFQDLDTETPETAVDIELEKAFAETLTRCLESIPNEIDKLSTRFSDNVPIIASIKEQVKKIEDDYKSVLASIEEQVKKIEDDYKSVLERENEVRERMMGEKGYNAYYSEMKKKIELLKNLHQAFKDKIQAQKTDVSTKVRNQKKLAQKTACFFNKYCGENSPSLEALREDITNHIAEVKEIISQNSEDIHNKGSLALSIAELYQLISMYHDNIESGIRNNLEKNFIKEAITKVIESNKAFENSFLDKETLQQIEKCLADAQQRLSDTSVSSYADEILESMRKDRSLSKKIGKPERVSGLIYQLKVTIGKCTNNQSLSKIEGTVDALTKNIEKVNDLLEEINAFKTDLEGYDPTKIESLTSDSDEEMQEILTSTPLKSGNSTSPALKSQKSRRARASTFMIPSCSEAFSTNFSEYQSIQKSFELIQEKTAAMQGLIRDIQVAMDRLRELSEMEEVDEHNIEKQIRRQEERMEKIKEIEVSIEKLKNLKLKNKKKPIETESQIQEECLTLFNQKNMAACEHYAAQMEREQLYLSQAANGILDYLNSMDSTKEEEYKHYRTRIEAIIDPI